MLASAVRRRERAAKTFTGSPSATGAKRPSGMALKLLTIVQKDGLKVLA
jgi:hypothetical protein